MNKRVLSLMAGLGMIAGGYVPVLLGDSSLLDGWSIIGGLIGGLVGIWLGAILSKRFG